MSNKIFNLILMTNHKQNALSSDSASKHIHVASGIN